MKGLHSNPDEFHILDLSAFGFGNWDVFKVLGLVQVDTFGRFTFFIFFKRVESLLLDLDVIEFVPDLFRRAFIHLIMLILHKWWDVSLRHVMHPVDLLPSAAGRVECVSHLLLQSSASLHDSVQLAWVGDGVVVFIDIYNFPILKI